MKTKSLTLSGILGAMVLMLLFINNYVPFNRMFLYMIVSFIVSIVIIETNLRYGIMFYLVTAILAFLILPNKTYSIPYIVFFGCYGIIKYFIEKDRNIIVEYLLKFGVFNLLAFIAWQLIKLFIKVKLTIVLVIGAEVLFLVYDFAYSYFIRYYQNNIRKKLRM